MKMEIQTFKIVGSIFILPSVALCYDSAICERALTIAWLWWAIGIVEKNEMHL